MAEDELAGGPYIPLGGDLSGGDCGGGCGGGFAGHCLEYCESPTAHCNVLNWEQVQRLDGILSETIPIHGRGNFPTLELQPSLIVKVVRRRLAEKRIGVRDVRLNGSAASHVLHQDSGLGYKDLDLIFCADLRGEEEFQTVKDVVLDCLLDFLPEGVNKEKITPLTLKVNHLPPPPPPQRGPGPPRRAGRECCTADTRGSGRPPGPVCAPWLILLFSYLIFFLSSRRCVDLCLSVFVDLLLQRPAPSASSSALPSLPSPYFLTLGFPCLSPVRSSFVHSDK